MSASDNPAQADNTGSANNQGGCDSASNTSWTELLKSLCNLKDIFKALLDAGTKVTTSFYNHLLELSKVEAFIQQCQTTRTIGELQGDLEAVNNALSIFVYKVEVLSGIIENDDTKKSITEALKENDYTPLKAFLARVQHVISEIIEAYQDFYKVYKALKDSIDELCQLVAQHLSTTKCKKCDAAFNGTFWTVGFGVVASGLGIFGIAALTGYVALATAPAIFLTIGFGGTTVCSVWSGVMNYNAHSGFSEAEQQLKVMDRELAKLTNDALALKNKGRNFYIALQQCSANADALLQLCEEQGYAKTMTMLNSITVKLRIRTDLQARESN